MHTATSRRPARPAPRRRRLLFGLLLAGALLAAGCRDSGPGRAVFTRQGNAPLRIAVLPFASPANAPDAGEVVTSTVITYLLATHAVEVVEPGMVEKAMRAARFAPESSGGLDPDTLAVLQQQLNVDAYLLGRVEEFGDVRIGPDTYPAVSFSARLVRATDDTILWAASISRTGADKVKVFDIGRVSSVGKLTKSAVAELAASLQASSGAFTPAEPDAPTPRPQTARPVPGAKTFALNPLFADEGRSYAQADLVALLAEVPGFTRGPVSYRKHAFDTVTALYGTEGAGIDVQLVDYQKLETAKAFITRASEDLQPEQLDSHTAFAGDSAAQNPGVYHLNLAAGRFGLYLTGPASAKEKLQQLAVGLIGAK